MHGGSYFDGALSIKDARKMAPFTVVAAGVQSATLMRALGHAVPMIAERGYHIQSEQTRWPEALPPVVIEDRALVVTRFSSALRATSFVEFTHMEAAPDPRKWARLKQHARALGLPFDGEISTWHGARPTLPDYLPALGRSRAAPDVFYAFGHQHLGLTLGPFTGEIMAALVLGESTPVGVDEFTIERFG
jgi:D-amino-acid dehydrogenase